MAELNKILVPVATHTDPNNPDGAAGSINLAMDTHPMEHAEDYGQGYDRDLVHSPADVHAAEASEGGLPANRDDWLKDDWKAQAEAYGLHTSGNLDTLIARVEEYEQEEGL